MLKKFNTKIKAFIALAAALGVTFATVASSATVHAEGTLTGIQKVVESVKGSQNKTYRILEIVPADGLGEVGYMTYGGEYGYVTSLMSNYMKTGSSTSFDARKSIMSKIVSNLSASGICTQDSWHASSYPLYLQSVDSYSEEYELKGDDTDSSYHLLEFPNGITEQRTQNGIFEANAANLGGYDLLTATGAIPSDGASVEPECFSDSADGYYYVVMGTSPDGALTQFGRYSYTNGSFIKDDAGIYYVIGYFKYDGQTLSRPDDAAASTESTAASAATFVADSTSESSSSSTQQFVAGSTSTTPAPTAPTQFGARMNALYFKYTGTAGGYDFIENDAGRQYRTSFDKIYYSIGFVSSGLIEKNVFGAMGESSDFRVKVDSFTPAELSGLSAQSLSYDMYVICGDNFTGHIDAGDAMSGLTFLSTAGAYNTSTSTYSSDMTFEQMKYIYGMAADSSIESPVIVDWSVLSGAKTEGITDYSAKCPMTYRLAALCTQKDIQSTYQNFVMQAANVSGVNWTVSTNYFNSINQKNYVLKNVYCFNDVSSNTSNTNMDIRRRLATGSFTDAFTNSDSLKYGFFDISELISSENAIRSGDDRISETVNQAKAIQYIVNYHQRRQIAKKSSLSVLEIEPCCSYDLKAADIKNMNSEFNSIADENVKITQMSTAEFIGKIDDLNTTYDIIYIGGNIGKLYTDANGNTTYNDQSMNGLIYSHVGDQVYCNEKLGGLLISDYVGNSRANCLKSRNDSDYVGSYRYGGNDITTSDIGKIVDFLAAKCAVIVDSSLYTTANGSRSVNSYTVDNSSNMYTLLDKIKDFANMATATVARNKDGTAKPDANGISVTIEQKPGFFYYMNMPKLSLALTNEDNTSSGKMTTVSWDITMASTTEVTTATYYDIRLYFDLNADGKYSSSENIPDITVYGKNPDGSYSALSKTAKGTYSLKTGSYRISRVVVGEFSEELPWKIEAVQTNNSSIRGSLQGHREVKSTSTMPDIQILQIMQSSTETGGYSNNWNMQTDSGFKSLLSQVKDYNIVITSVNSDKFVKDFNESASLSSGAENILDKYDMIIMGFADVYRDIDNTVVPGNKLGIGPVTAIEAYIADGKSVLFTHDTTSFVNVPSAANYHAQGSGNLLADYWGYNINTVMRNIVGMDRYGITGVDSLGNLNDTANLLRSGSPLSIYSYGSGYASNGKALTGNDCAFTTKNNRLSTYSETQGYTDSMLNENKLAKSAKYSVDPSKAAGITNYGSSGNGSFANMFANKINDGLITEYPFKISDTIPIAVTHFQYYQLDMEADDDGDGESDIVVWYTIGGSNSAANNTPYTAVKNDVRNNYYIYSKGNVMYSGVGHSKVNTSISGDTQEAKLFINTIVAAYKNGVQNPAITAISGPAIDSAVNVSNYFVYDEELSDTGSKGNMDSNGTDIYYSVFDSNLATTKDISVKYYIESSDGNDSIVPGVKLTELTGISTVNVTSGAEVSGLESGNVYQAHIANPYTLLEGKSSVNIYVVAQSSFEYYGKTYSGLTGFTKVSLTKKMLFDME